MRSRLGLAAAAGLLSACVFLSTLAAQNTPPVEPAVTRQPHIDPAIHNALQSRKYADAVKRIDQALGAETKDANAKDYLITLKGRALTELGKYDEATAAFLEVEQGGQNDQSRREWLSRARFGRADIFVRTRHYEEAAAIYRTEAERLLSRERKDELAAVYLEFADRYYDGVPAKDPSEAPQHDYSQALTYYQEALKLGPTLRWRQRIEFRIARCLQELQQWDNAIGAFKAFLKTHASKETKAEERAAAEMVSEAKFEQGRSELSARRMPDARETWQDFLRESGATGTQQTDAVKELRAKAAYRLAHTYGIPGSVDSNADLELGVAAAQKFIAEYPAHKLAPQAELEIAQAYSRRGRHPQAVSALQALLANPRYAESEVVPLARRMLGDALVAQKKYTEAIVAWKDFLEKHPIDPNWSSVQANIVNVEFLMAEEQRREENYDAARTLWETFLNKYPQDNRAAQILFNFGMMKFEQGAKSRADRIKSAVDEGRSPQSVPANEDEKKLFEAALSDWRKLVSKYPTAEVSSQAAFMVGVTLEDHLARLADALEAYKKVPGSYQQQAQRRISALTAKQLEILTERKFRTDEKPRIKLVTRNLEAVTVKMYRIDMTDYFRKMHLASGVESLDISLIDPEKQWEHKVAGYAEFRRMEQDVEIPMDGPGVLAVTVASEKTEATTMVVVSDLDVIVKTSRNELFLYAQNMRTGEPMKGVSILVSDGSEIFSEAVTGESGILQHTHEKLKSISDLRVFAVNEGHAASTVSSLNGLDFAVGLTPRGYLYTDRPAYRAGQLVNIKGIVRWVDADRFTFKAGEKFTLDVYDARSRLLHTREVTLNEFGTVTDNLALPDSAPQGQYRVQLHRKSETAPEELSFETSFQVLDYALEPVRLTVEPARKVYYRGETIEGKISLKYYYGTPLAGRDVMYRLGNERWTTAATNDLGEISFKFETEQFNESQPLVIHAQFAERGLNLGETVFLATRGFEIAASTLRSVYINGETFDAVFSVQDPAGKPVATDLKVEVLEQTNVRGVTGERLVATYNDKTDADKGEARRTLNLDAGGRYFIRASGVDRFGNTISGQSQVLISGAKDTVRLRVLADKHQYNVGDQAKVRFHWREAPALALVTYEGASILGHQLVKLQTGSNEITVPMGAELAPNFTLAVAVMERNRFHAAGSEFQVARKLNIKLTPNATTLTPGGTVSVDVQVTDPQGNPVSAEISLGLVQANLLGMFKDPQPVVDTFFGAGRRRTSIRQSTSCTFSYSPNSKDISQQVLAEAERRSAVGREAESLRRLQSSNEITNSEEALGMRRRLGERLAENQRLRLEANEAGLGGEFWDVERTLVNPLEDGFAYSVESNQALSAGAPAGLQSYTQRNTTDYSIPSDAPNQPAQQYDAQQSGAGQQPGAGRRGGGGGRGRGGARGGAAAGAGGGGGGGFGGGGAAGPFGGALANPGPMVGGPGNGPINRDIPVVNGVTITGNGIPAYGQPQDQGSLGIQHGNTDLGDAPKSLEDFFPQSNVNRESAAALSRLGRQGYANSSQLNETIQKMPTEDRRDAWGMNGLTRSGKFIALNADVAAELARSGADGIQIFPGAAETAFWDPRILTDNTGVAKVSIPLPDRSTAWNLRAKGITRAALAGQAEAELITRKDLFAEVKLPQTFTIGDKSDVLVEVHNALPGARTISVVLKSTIGEKSTEITREVDVQGPGISELSIPVEVLAGDQAGIEVTLSTSGEGDARITDQSAHRVGIRPYGWPVFATSGGSSSQSTIAFVKFGDNVAAENPSLEIHIGASLNRSLLEAVLGSDVRPLHRISLPASGIERATSDVLGGVALLDLIGASRNAGTPEATALTARIRAAVSQLVSSQRNDGGWAWSGKQEHDTDKFLTSRIVWALASAKQAGIPVPETSLNLAVANLKGAFVATSQTDREAQAILLHGLAMAGEGDFAAANRLHRERNNLSDSGLLHVALALAKMDRKEMAAELLALVKGTQAGTPAPVPTSWLRDRTEIDALHLLAICGIAPTDAKGPELAEKLFKARLGIRWPIEKTNGPAIASLAAWLARARYAQERYSLIVQVNGEEVERLTLEPETDGTRTITVPARLIQPNTQQRIEFQLVGRGTFSYSAILTGFVPAEKLAKSTDDFTISRQYQPATRMLDGEAIARGFSVVSGNYSSFTNPLTELPVGERGEVTIRPRRRVTQANVNNASYDYLVITETIPAGCTVLADSVQGAFQRYELSPGCITFYVDGSVRFPGDISYTLVGSIPGQYRAAQTIVRDFYDPSRMAVAEVKELKVLVRKDESGDNYRLSPDELFHFGKKLQAKGDHAGAHEHLTKLMADWRLRDDIYKETVTMLFQSSLALNSNPDIVKHFEIIKERFPDVEVSFENILRVARAYTDIREFERSYLVYRSTVQASFEKESQVAGFLRQRGEFVRSSQTLESLLHDYPAEGYIATATYALAQEVYRKAPEAANDVKLKEAKLTRVDLINAAVQMLDHFVSTWPEDPAADQASFSLANALLDLEQYQPAIARCEQYAQWYPTSKLLDSFWYMTGYSQFQLGRYEEALKMCAKVAETVFPMPGGGTRAADNKWEAIYIMGQIHHSRSEPAQAISEYQRVKDRFADAAEAIRFFERKDIHLEEITTIKPSDPRHVTLKFRNVSEAAIKVYRIDLMKFGLMQRNLDRITAINLAGIRPYHEQTVKLGDGKDYRDREQEVNLPLEEEGAYLVVVRGDQLYASGLALVSPLALEVQEDATSGRVRVTVKDVAAGKYADDINVRVIGSANGEFTAGETDLRGLFIADNIRGTSTVIAMSNANRYAFYRGETPLQNAPQPAAAPVPQQVPQGQGAGQQAGGKAQQDAVLRNNIFMQNGAFQQEQNRNYDNLLNNSRSGIQVKEAVQ